MIFLDAAATTPVRREVLEAMWPYLTGEFGNPSSHHSLGEAAAAALAGARAATAKALGCRPGEVVFTSGGTEADNLAVKGIALARRAADPRLDRVAISAVEHPAVEESARYLERVHGFAVDVIPVDRFGQVSEEALAAVLQPGTALVSIMYANNEVGTVQPIARLAALARAHGVPFHTDAVQAAGWLPLDTGALGVDALSISGHKLGAPKGSGALFVRGRVRLEPLVHGGGQERGRRSGTENVAGAVALATALALPREPAGHVAALRDGFIDAVLAGVPGALLTGHPTERLPVGGILLLPGHERRVRAAGARTPGHHLLQRFRVCRRLGCALTRAAGPGHRARDRPDGGAVQLRLDRDGSAVAGGGGRGPHRRRRRPLPRHPLHRLSRHYMSLSGRLHSGLNC